MRTILASLLLVSACAWSQNVQVVKLEKLLTLIDHKDTVYVVNFWATWCKPCIQELPSFDSLAMAHRGEKLKVLLVSLDFAEDVHTRVVPFLKKNQFKLTCVLLDESNGNDFINRIDPAWSGAIPATLIKAGARHSLIEKKVHKKELESLIDKILRQ